MNYSSQTFIFKKICSTSFWDNEISWQASYPQLTDCFVDTALTWPSIFLLWLYLPINLYEYFVIGFPKSFMVKWKVLSLSRFISSMVLVLVGLVHACHDTFASKDVNSPANFMAVWLRVSGYFIALVYIEWHLNRRCLSAYGPVWFYLLISIVSDSMTLLFNRTHFNPANNLVSIVCQCLELANQVILLVLCSFPKNFNVPSNEKICLDKGEQKNLCPKVYTSLPSKLTFWWFNHLTWIGHRRPLTANDLWSIRSSDSSQKLFLFFNKFWNHPVFKPSSFQESLFNMKTIKQDSENREWNEVRTESSNLNLWLVLIKMFWKYMFWPSLARTFTDLLPLVNSVLLKYMILFSTKNDEPLWHGIFYSIIFFLVNLIQSLMGSYQQHRASVVAMRIQTSLIGTIYRKSLLLSMSAKKDHSTGDIVNLMAIDSQRFMDLIPQIHFLWISPIQIIITFYLLWNELGPSVIGGFVLLCFFIPIHGCISRRVKLIQAKQMKLKDLRLKSFNEILNGMKIVKLYAWERPFIKQIEAIRAKELTFLKRSGIISLGYVVINVCSPLMITFMVFAIYTWTSSSHLLTSEKAFVTITLFNMLRVNFIKLPNVTNSFILTTVSLKRINHFLNAQEVRNFIQRPSDMGNVAISIEQASFSWNNLTLPVENQKNMMTLKNLNLKVLRGKLVAVVGSVGSGKSSLLYTLLGEMQKFGGAMKIGQDLDLAYVAQQAWIENMTLRENILFRQLFDRKKYNRIIDACALLPDIEVLSNGDQTEIGEKGINLSGGQKQRISIARACYSDASLFLMDDPLSAVDSHVGKHIFEQVLSSKQGLLRGKTRLLVTNALYVLPFVDEIVLLKNGTIDAIGSYQSLLQNNESFNELITSYTQAEQHENKQQLEKNQTDSISDLNLSRKFSIKRRISQSSNCSTESSLSVSSEKGLNEKKNEKTGKIIETETIQIGHITYAVYTKFFKSLSLFWSMMIIISYFCLGCSNTGGNFWISGWSQQADTGSVNGNFYLSIYFFIGLIQIASILFGWVSIVFGCLNASRTLHNRLLSNIIHAPMHFFDVTPFGRILNRFSKDIDIIDVKMADVLRVTLNNFYPLVATLFVVSFQTPIFLAFVLPFIVSYYFIQRFYISTSRQLKRLEMVSRSPILSHFSATITGVTTIKAYKASDQFIAEFEDKVDENTRCLYPSVVAGCWLQVRLEFLANMLIFIASFIATLTKLFSNNGVGLTGSQIGLSLSYALNVTRCLNLIITKLCEMENNIVSVERISEYTDLMPEAAWDVAEIDKKTPLNWPTQGRISFENYCTRYRPGLDLVLADLNFKIRKNEKIGIVGRTGAGKSSLTLGLFRIIEASQGKINIDNVHIENLGLQHLRSRITIIPQDPVLFSGTVRFNLDPFKKFDDEHLWKVLELAHLKTFISSLELGLDYFIQQGGENLSVGQRQLICLARALLKRTNLLVLDEATAAVDFETDALIQSTIRQEFSECTIMTIAHRLNTIIDSDRVLVLDAGRVAEFDSPQKLLNDNTTIFHSLAKDANLI